MPTVKSSVQGWQSAAVRLAVLIVIVLQAIAMAISIEDCRTDAWKQQEVAAHEAKH